MNEKEFNLAILAELRRIANEVFSEAKVSQPGTYTAQDLWKGKNAIGERIYIFFRDNFFKTYAAKVDTFTFEVSNYSVWETLHKFETLCHIKPADKTRFTYGEAQNEIITAKAMYLDKSGKAATRKKNMVKISDRAAMAPNRQTKKFDMYYFSAGLWFLVLTGLDENQCEVMKERFEKDENCVWDLLQKWGFDSETPLQPIYRALFDAMKSEQTNNTPEQRKSENEAENTVICKVAKVNTSAKEFNKHEALKGIEKRMREYHPNDIALIRYNGMYYSYGESAKNVRLSDGVRDYITDPGDYICFPESLLDEVLTKPIKAGRGVLTCDIIEDMPEDYPPEPYNKEKSENVATSYERFQDRTICGRFQKNMCPNYLRQKVFPAESFQSRRKIIRFKPRYFVGYTNYHLWEENVLERKRNGNTSVYRVLIRGETMNAATNIGNKARK